MTRNWTCTILDSGFADKVNYGSRLRARLHRICWCGRGKKAEREHFFGINEDIEYLAEWLNTFITRKERWESPKYLIGESYGGTRVMGLSAELQEKQWMYLNGVIMVSPADYKVIRVGGPVSSALNLPYYSAAAWFHKKLNPELQQKDLKDILPEVEKFAINKLIPALAKGGFILENELQEISSKMSSSC